MRLAPPHQDLLARTHALWDHLADFDAANTDAALAHLLSETEQMVSAQNAYWLGGIRLSDDERDSLCGWRPRSISYLHRSSADTGFARAEMREIAQGAPGGLEARAHTREAGKYRARRLRDLDLSRSDLETCRVLYRERGIHDVLWVVAPVSEDAESYYGFHRKTPNAPFTTKELEAAAYAMRGIKWFHRQVMLSHGLLVAQEPLAPAERRVVALLLTPRSEKQIATALGLTAATTHKYVTDVLRKFGVSGRSGLTALWLGSALSSRHPS